MTLDDRRAIERRFAVLALLEQPDEPEMSRRGHNLTQEGDEERHARWLPRLAQTFVQHHRLAVDEARA